MSGSRPTASLSSPDRLTLSSPDALLAGVPHLLGFPPQDSVVLVGLAPDEQGRAMIRLTQRFDSPSATTTEGELRAIAQAATSSMVSSGTTSVVIAVFGDENPGLSGVVPQTDLVDRLIESLEDSGVTVKDALYSDGASRWSYGCDNPSCCPVEGVPIPDQLRTMIAAEFAGSGAAMSSSRQAVVDEVAADPACVEVVGALLPNYAPPQEGLEEWRDQGIARVLELRQTPVPSPEHIAETLAGLSDIRVRDTVLWELARDGAGMDNVTSAMTIALRGAPEGHAAPVATCLAVQHWTRGDGTRANACLDRAGEDNPNYSLAGMVGTAIGRGLPPSSWTEVMRQMSRDECRKDPRHEATAAPQTEPARISTERPAAPSLAS